MGLRRLPYRRCPACRPSRYIAQARALHTRRELHKGLDHGLALMDPLDLSPRGLDPMDRAIAQLDTLEAPDEDLEP